MPDGRDKLKKLHENLVKDGYSLPDYATFEADMSDSNKLKKLHGTLMNDGYQLPDETTFRNDMGYGEVKKKVGGKSWLDNAYEAASQNSNGLLSGGGLSRIGAAAKPVTEEQSIQMALKNVKHSPATGNEKKAPEVDQTALVNDPIGTLISPIKDRRAEIKTLRQGVESVGQDPVSKLHISNEASRLSAEENNLMGQRFSHSSEAKEFLEDKLDPTKLKLKEGKQVAFPNVPSLDDYTDESIIKATGNNLTAKIAGEQYLKNKKVRDAIAGSTDITDAAIKYEGDKRGVVGGQIKALSGDIPNAMKGNILLGFVQDPDVLEVAKDNPELAEQIRFTVKNFPTKFPEAAARLLSELVSKEREERGDNNGLLNITSAKNTDEIVEDLFANGELPKEYKDFYSQPEVRFMVNKSLKTPGFIENVGTGIKTGVLGIGKSVAEATGIRDLYLNKEQKLFNTLQQDYENVQFSPKGFVHNLTTHGGLITGQVLPLMGGGAAIRGLGLIKNAGTANMIMAGMQTFGENLDRARADLPGENDTLQLGKATIDTGIEIALANVLNETKLAKDLVRSVSPEIKGIVKRFTTKEITSAQAKAEVTTLFNKALSVAGKFVKGQQKTALNETVEETATHILQNANNQAFGGQQQSTSQQLEDAFDVAATTYLGSQFLGIGGGIVEVNKNPEMGKVIYGMASSPQKYIDVMKAEAALDPEYAKDIDQKLDNLQYIVDVKKELDGRKMKEGDKEKYLLKSLSEKMLTEKTKAVPDKSLNKENEKKLAEIAIEKESILNPDKSNSAIIEEFYDEDLIPKSDRVHLESQETGKFSENKVGEYLKYIAQQANSLTEDWQYDETGKPNMEHYPPQLIELANERWKYEIEKAVPDRVKKIRAAIIMPDEKKNTFNVPLKSENPSIDQVRDLPDENTPDERNFDPKSDIDVTGQEAVIPQEATPIPEEVGKEQAREKLKEKYGVYLGGEFDNHHEISYDNKTQRWEISSKSAKYNEEKGYREFEQKTVKRSDAKNREDAVKELEAYAKEKGITIYDGSNSLSTEATSFTKENREKFDAELAELENKPTSSTPTKEEVKTSKAKPIRQLGTGANVYYEAKKYRVNDLDNGKVVLNVGDMNGEVPLANIEFSDINEAVFVAKKLNDNAPEGLVYDYHNIKKIVDGYKDEYKSLNLQSNGKTDQNISGQKDKGTSDSTQPSIEESPEKLQKRYERVIGETDLTDPYDIVLNHFASGGKINGSAIAELFGGRDPRINQRISTESERRAKISIIGKDAKSIDELAHSMWESDPTGKYDTQDYKNAIESVLLDYNSKSSMQQSLADKYDLQAAYEKYEAMKQGQEAIDIVEQMTEEDINHLLQLDAEEVGEFIDQRISTNEKANQQQPSQEDKSGNKSSKEAVVVDEVVDKDSGAAVPPKPPKEEVIVGGEEGNIGGITHAANEVRRKDRALSEYQKEPQTFEEWNSEAEKAIKGGYDVEALIERIEKGHDPTPVENAIRKIYVATLDAEIAKNPTDELLAKQKRFIEAGDLANSRAGRNLVSLKGEGSPLESISDFYVAKMEAAGVDKLTEKQKKETKEAFDKVQKADENATAAMEAYVEEIAKLKAENELLKQKKANTPKKEKGDFAKQRKDAIDGAREALKKLRTGESGLTARIPLVNELIAIAPHVKKYVGSLLSEGAYNLKEVVSKAYEEFKDILEGLSEKDIQGIIAGEYNPKKPTRNELAAKMRDLRDEAYYANKLERLLAGEEPANETKKVKRNAQIADLQKKIKDISGYEAEVAKAKEDMLAAKAKAKKSADKDLDKVEKELDSADEKSKKQQEVAEEKERKRLLAEAEKDRKQLEREFDKEKKTEEKARLKAAVDEARRIEKELSYRSPEQKALDAIIKRNQKQEAEIRERIAKGDFETKKKIPFLEDPEMQRKFPREYKAALDAIVKREEARHDFDVALLKDQMAKRNLGKKGIDLAGDVIGTTKALVTGIDASGIGIQNLLAMVAHPRSAAKALPASFTDFASAKNQDRWLASVHSSSLYPLAKKAGLDITEPQSLKAKEREDQFTHNLLDRQIKYKGKKYVISKYITKPFERIFTGLGNRMRWNLWSRGVEKLHHDGYTWESHPEEFKSLAKILNTETGRGSLHPQIDKAFNLVSAGIWSPRLMASRMNILGLGDIGNLAAGGKKGYYGGLTPKMRAYAIKDFAKFVTFGLTFMGLAALSFADEVDLDPNSSTFGTFSVNGKRYNIWGGFTQYVRFVAKLIAGGEKGGDGEFRKTGPLKTALRFLWSKTTPVVGTAIGWGNQDKSGTARDYMGQPMTTEGTAESLLVPLSIRGMIKGVKQEGAGSLLWTGIPSFVGVNVNYESDFEDSADKSRTKSTREPRQSNPRERVKRE